MLYCGAPLGRTTVKNRVCEVGGGGAHMGIYFRVAGPLKAVRRASQFCRLGREGKGNIYSLVSTRLPCFPSGQ